MGFEDLFGLGPSEASMDPNPTVVVNLRRDPYDVYIGRAGHGLDGYFGNPVRRDEPCFECGRTHLTGGSTIECFELYARRRITEDPEYRARVTALWGRRLGCFCKPQRCHGDVLRQITHELHEEVK